MKKLVRNSLFITIAFIFSFSLTLNNSLAALNSSVDGQIADFNNQIEQRQSEIDQLNADQIAYQEEIEQKKRMASTLQGQIEVFNLQIQALEEKIGTTEIEIEFTGLEIDKLTEEIREKEIEINNQKIVLSEVLVTIYEASGDTQLEILLENSHLSDYVDKITYINDIQSSLKDQLSTVKRLKEDLESRKKKVEDKSAELEILRLQLEGERKDLDAQKQAKEDLLVSTMMMEAEFQKLLAQARADEESNDQAIQDLVGQISTLQSGSAGSGYFRYPMDNNFCVTAYYMDPNYCPFGSCGTPHYGIDVGTWTGTPVYATADGTAIVHAAPLGTANLNYIVIMHPDVNMVTLYLHLSGFAISGTTPVSKGQIIGYTGGAFGSWGSGLSTGPHFHYEIRDLTKSAGGAYWAYLGGPVNPLEYTEFAPSCY